jgi:hypothetical protein
LKFGELVVREDSLHLRHHVGADGSHLCAAVFRREAAVQISYFFPLVVKHRLNLRYLIGSQVQIRGELFNGWSHHPASHSTSGRAASGWSVGVSRKQRRGQGQQPAHGEHRDHFRWFHKFRFVVVLFIINIKSAAPFVGQQDC